MFELLEKTFNLKKEAIIVGAAAIVLVGSILGYLLVRGDSDVIVETQKEAAGPSQTDPAVKTAQSSVTSETSVISKIKVYVTGCVNSPGIVTLSKGQLIDDAIRLAGGATAEADLEGINLVYELNENLMLHIKSKKEATAQGTGTSGEAGRGAVLVKDSGGTVVNENSMGGSSSGAGKLININTAGTEELDKLPGIGQATAEDIVAYRESNGPFKSIQDIMKVPRIKESRFAEIKDFITVD